jgi:DNA-binding IclR family transcriptional regulator
LSTAFRGEEAGRTDDGTQTVRRWNGGKALTVLDAVAEHGRPVRFTELLEDSPFPKATLYRFVQTLTAQGMLSYDPERQTYAPGLRLVRLAHAAWQASSLAPIARPYLDDLSRATGETVHLAQLDGGQVLYVDKRNATDPVEMYSQAGKVGPAYCTGVGKAMLAYLPEAELAPVLRSRPGTVHAQDDHHRRGHARRTGRDPRARPCLRPTRNTSPASSASRCRSWRGRGACLAPFR